MRDPYVAHVRLFQIPWVYEASYNCNVAARAHRFPPAQYSYGMPLAQMRIASLMWPSGFA